MLASRLADVTEEQKSEANEYIVDITVSASLKSEKEKERKTRERS